MKTTKRLSPTQKQRAVKAAETLFAEVEDYFNNADCGDGGEGKACAKGWCWHCRSRVIVSHVRNSKPLVFTK